MRDDVEWVRENLSIFMAKIFSMLISEQRYTRFNLGTFTWFINSFFRLLSATVTYAASEREVEGGEEERRPKKCVFVYNPDLSILFRYYTMHTISLYINICSHAEGIMFTHRARDNIIKELSHYYWSPATATYNKVMHHFGFCVNDWKLFDDFFSSLLFCLWHRYYYIQSGIQFTT